MGRACWERLMLMWSRCSSPSPSTSTWTWSYAAATLYLKTLPAMKRSQVASAHQRTPPLPLRPPHRRTNIIQFQMEGLSPDRLLLSHPWLMGGATTTILTHTTTICRTCPTRRVQTLLCFSQSWWACPWSKAPAGSASPLQIAPWAKKWRWSWMLSGVGAYWRATSSRRSTDRMCRPWVTPRWWTSLKTCLWAVRSTFWCSEEVSRSRWRRALQQQVTLRSSVNYVAAVGIEFGISDG